MEYALKDKWAAFLERSQPQTAFLYPLSSWCEYAYDILLAEIEKSPSLSRWISPDSLFSWLLRDFQSDLLPIIERCLVLELHTCSEQGLLKSKSSSERFFEFIREMNKPENMAALLDKYEVLKKLFSVKVNDYIDNMLSLFKHLELDCYSLEKTFFSGHEILTISNIHSSGDKHCHGKSVKIISLTLDNHKIKKVVYKPRSMAVDNAFQCFLDWFNRNQFGDKLLTMTVLDKNEYGWAEYIEHADCCEEKEVKEFYRQSGILLCLLYMLGGNDIHSENIIACGKNLMIVDLECLFKPVIPTREEDVHTYRPPTVMQSLILPYKFMVRKNYAGIDLTSMGYQDTQETPYKTMVWESVGTDKMAIKRVNAKLQKNQNHPTLCGKPVKISDYEEELISGFKEAYQICLSHREQLLHDELLLGLFKRLKVRVLFRGTYDYVKLLSESYHPKLLYNRSDYDTHFSWLNEILDYFPNYKNIIPSEILDLTIGNIPYFYARSDGNAIYDSGDNQISIPVLKSGWQCFYDHLKNDVSSSDMSIQVQIIKNSFVAYQLNQELINKKRHRNKINFSAKKPSKDQQPIEDRALIIADQVIRHLDTYQLVIDDHISWPTIELEYNKAWNPAFTGLDLYNGLAGIGLTYAYAGNMLQNSAYTETANLCVQTLRMEIEKLPIVNIGAYAGLGGMLYALTQFYKLWGDKQLISDINTAAKFALFKLNDGFPVDLIGGYAGLLIGVIRAHALMDADLFNQLVDQCLAFIFEKYPEPSVFPMSNDLHNSSQPLLGFAHGVSGIAWVLSECYKYRRLDVIAKWIDSALAYERQYFNAFENNWPDFRNGNLFESIERLSKTQSTYKTAWCHGSAGVGFSRLAMMHTYPDAGYAIEMDAALNNVMNAFGQMTNTSLCHGYLGNLDLLLCAASYKQALYDKYYYALVDNMLSGFEECGVTFGLPENGASVGLMTGVAGVAYQCMRIAKPKQVPSILVLT